MSNMFGNDDQNDRKDDHNSLGIKFRGSKMRHGNELCCCYFFKIYNPADDGCCISSQNRNEDRDNCQEFAEQDGTKYSHPQSHQEYNDLSWVNVLIQKTCVGSCIRGQFQTDQRHYRAHSCRRKHDVDPICTEFINDQS